MKRRRWRRRIRIAHGRLYICRRRCHHGFTGCVLVLIGIALAIHDRADAPWFPALEWADR